MDAEVFAAKNGVALAEDGTFAVSGLDPKTPRTLEVLLDQIKANLTPARDGLESRPYDHRVFVMVCGGPSLSDHLSEIRVMSEQPDKYLVVCSNMTARFLVKSGITPHAQFILDPKENKVHDLTDVPKDIPLWLSLTCHPDVFKRADEIGRPVKVFLACGDNEGRDIKAIHENAEFGRTINGIQGGTMAGTRAMNLADLLGFHEMVYFGLDASVLTRDDAFQPYAYYKPRGDTVIEVECDRCGVKFDTTTVFQAQVNEILMWHARMPWLKIEMRGSGLMQHYWSHVMLEEAAKRAARPQGLYSPEYKAMQEQMHTDNANTDHEYGVSGSAHAIPVFSMASQILKRKGYVSVLDYGSAGGGLFKAIDGRFYVPRHVMTFNEYEPFIAGKNNPIPCDLVVCLDVLEHIEPEYIDNVLDHIAALTKSVAYLSVCLVEAMKKLPDGRNAHILIRDTKWWMRKIRERFVISEVAEGGTNLVIVAQSMAAVRAKSMGN